MGNEISSEVTVKSQGQDFAQFLKQRKRKQAECIERTDKYTYSPELKWRSELIQSLESMGKDSTFADLCEDLMEVVKNIKIQNYIKAISILNAMNSQDILQLNSKQVLKQTFNFDGYKQSQNVFLDLGSRFCPTPIDSVSTDFDSVTSPTQSRLKKSSSSTTKKGITSILVREFNQHYHPIKIIKDSFMMMFQMKYREKLNQMTIYSQQKSEQIQNQMHLDLKFYCEFVVKGCSIYRKWIVKYSKLREDRYQNFMKGVVMDSLFLGQSSFHGCLFPFIKELSEQPVKRMWKNIKDNMGVECFQLKDQLKIDGNYICSLITLQDFDQLTSPRRMLQILENLKDHICNDIDQFHQLFKSDKSYKIDGDNFLGIICFLLCRLKPKLLEIYTQITILTVIYGEDVNILFQTASYMVTAFQASFDHFLTEQFAPK